MNETIERFIRLFRGRGDAYGTWTGGAIREPLTAEQFTKHLTSTDSADWIGVYPLIPDGDRSWASWGCIDIDGADFPVDATVEGYNRKDPTYHDWWTMAVLAQNVKMVGRRFGIPILSERTRNGIHLWVFPAEGKVAAATMRRALMACCTAAHYHPNEVNPKQETHVGVDLGNYVRLPYPADTQRCDGDEPTVNILDVPERSFYAALLSEAPHTPARSDYRPWTLDQFLDNVRLTPTQALEHAASMWSPPVVHHHTFNTDVELDSNLRSRLSGRTFTIWKDGPLPGSDRSSTLVRLAVGARDDGLTPSEQFAVVWSADERWGKFHGREDGEAQVAKIIDSIT